MNLVYCCLEWEPVAGGGIRTYVESLAGYLLALGHRVHVVTFAHPGTNAGRCQTPSGVVVHRVAFSTLQRWLHRLSLATPLHGFLFRLFYSVQVQRAVAELIAGGEADLVESPDYAAEGFCLTLWQRLRRRARRTPHLVHLHTPSYLLHRINGQRWRLRNWPFEVLENWNLRHAAHLCAPSQALIDRVRRDLGLDGRAIRLEPYSSDVVGQLAAADETPAAPEPGPVRILYVGRLEFRKGVTFLIDALNALGSEDPTLQAVLIGGDTATAPGGGSMRAHLLERLRPELRGRVQLVDRLPRHELFGRYREASFCVLPSLFENFANTCLEAIAMGKVVVVPRDSGMAEMIADGETGFAFRNGDVADLIAAIRRCLQSRERWPAMAAAGRRLLLERFEPRRLVHRKLEFYESLIAAAHR